MIQAKSVRMLRFFMQSVFILTLALGACKPMPEKPNPARAAVPPSPYANPPASAAAPSSVRTAPVKPDKKDVAYQEIKVGLLLPLSGESADLGHALLDAAMLGLFDKYANAPANSGEKRIVLLPADTEGDPKKASAAAEKVIKQGAQLILGPLYSTSVQAVIPVAKKHNIQMINFSNNADVAGKHGFLYGFMPEEQVHRVLSAAEKEGIIRIAGLLPASRYGELVEDAIVEHTALYGTELAGVMQYPTDGSDIGPYVQKLLGNTSSKEPILFDGLFIAEGGESFTRLVEKLGKFRLTNKNIKYLGTGLLDDETLLGNPAIIGTWFASSPMVSYKGFITRFQSEYGYTPPRLASLGYDAVALAATLLERGGGFSREALLEPGGFVGPANGIFRFKADGTIERGLSVMAIDYNGMKEISAAPRMFY